MPSRCNCRRPATLSTEHACLSANMFHQKMHRANHTALQLSATLPVLTLHKTPFITPSHVHLTEARYWPHTMTHALHPDLDCREVQLAAILLWHAKLGKQSDWYPWIQALPTQFDTLPHWTSAQLDELQLSTTTTEMEFRSSVRPS